MHKGVIDPGHGGTDRANRGPKGYIEADGALKIATRLKSRLESTGQFQIKLTRDVDKTLSLTERCQIAIDFGADFIISEHTNASTNTTIRGSEVFYSFDIPGDKVWATKMSAGIASVLGVPDRGAKVRESEKYPGEDYYTMIDGCQDGGIPHVFIVESLFHSNPQDEALLLSDNAIDKIVDIQFRVLCEMYNVNPNTKVVSPVSGTPIIDKSELSAEQMVGYLLSVNPNPQLPNCTPLRLAQLFLSEGAIEGVRGDIAFAQALKETGFFKYGGIVLPTANNYAGLGALNNNAKGDSATFATPQLGVQAQIQHLKGYATTTKLVQVTVDPRYSILASAGKLGCAPLFEDLGGKWAVPGYDQKKYASFALAFAAGETYGQSIIQIFNKMAQFKVPVPVVAPPVVPVAPQVPMATISQIELDQLKLQLAGYGQALDKIGEILKGVGR